MEGHKTVKEILNSIDDDIEHIADTAVRIWGIFQYSDRKTPVTVKDISYIIGVPEKVAEDCLRMLEKRRKLIKKVDGGWVAERQSLKEIKPKKGVNRIHMFSGGLDSSYSLLKEACSIKKAMTKETIFPMFIDYGQFAAPVEWEATKAVVAYIRGFAGDSKLIDDPVRISLASDLFMWCHNVAFTGTEVGDEEPDIQNRNMVMLSVLCSYLIACAENGGVKTAEFKITSGFKEKEMKDCSESFFNGISQLLKSYKPNMIFTFSVMKDRNRSAIKREIKELLHGSEVELKKFCNITTSCYSPKNGKACGNCNKCKAIESEKASKQQ